MKKLVIQNMNDQFGHFLQQAFGVWDTERKCIVLPLDWRKDARERAEAFISQKELEI